MNDVEKRILVLSDELSKITNQLKDANERLANAEADWRGEKAEAKLLFEEAEADAWLTLEGHSGTVPEKTAEVRRSVRSQKARMIRAEHGDLYRTYRAAQSVTETLRSSSANIQSQLSGLQTIARNIRDQMSYATGRGG